MRPFAEQVEIKIGQDRWEAVGILDLDLPFAIARAQAVVSRPIGPTTLEQTGIMYALKLAFVTLLVDDGDASASGRKTRTTDESFSTCGPR
jgi:hypothetical protein